MQFVSKDSNQQESMVNELEDESGKKNFFLADPGLTKFLLDFE